MEVLIPVDKMSFLPEVSSSYPKTLKFRYNNQILRKVTFGYDIDLIIDFFAPDYRTVSELNMKGFLHSY